MRALLLEGKKKKCKNKMCVEWTREKEEINELHSKVNNRKKNTDAKGHEEAHMGDILKMYCWKEIMLPQIQQHGEEQVKAAIQLMNLSNQE
jgi:hypothetical protein